jgi:outer membrane protein assembly factor BamB
VDAIKKYKGEIFDHGDAENPLILENAVIFTTGGEENTMVALSKKDGSLVWKTKSLGGAKSYATPKLIHHNGNSLILTQTAENLIAINPENGEIIWHYNLIRFHLHQQGVGANTNVPLFFNGEIFVTSGYDHPGIKLALSADGKSVTEIWKNDTIDTHHGGVILVDGNLYGSNWQNNSKGRWASVNWETGRTNWEEEWYNKGSTFLPMVCFTFTRKKAGTWHW